VMEGSMIIGNVYPFKWRFRCAEYGTRVEQSIFIRDHVVRPLQEIVKVLSFKLNDIKRTQAKPSSSSSSKPSVAPVLAPVPKDFEADFEAFSVSYSFKDTLGELYRGVMQDLSRGSQFPGISVEDIIAGDDTSTAFKHTSGGDDEKRNATGKPVKSVAARAKELAHNTHQVHDSNEWSIENGIDAGSGGRAQNEMDMKHLEGVEPQVKIGHGTPDSHPPGSIPGTGDSVEPIRDSDGKFVETAAEIARREDLQRRLADQQDKTKKKKKRKFV